jgi:hypothetical protein
MNLDKKLNNGTGKGGVFRRRRYKCDLCEIYYTMYKCGEGDKARSREAVKEAKKINN